MHRYSFVLLVLCNTQFMVLHVLSTTQISASRPGTVNLLNDLRNSKLVDLCFVVDCTSSMTPYIQGVKDAILDIVANLTASASSNVSDIEQVRLAFVGYRDFGDQPEFDVLPFTSDVNLFQQFVQRVEANGGGDAPENVPGGLQIALQLDWLANRGSQILFHMGDEPCHSMDDNAMLPNGLPSSFLNAVGPIHFDALLPPYGLISTPTPKVDVIRPIIANRPTPPVHPDAAAYCISVREFPTEIALFQQLQAKHIDYTFGAITHATDRMLSAFDKAYGKVIPQFDVGVFDGMRGDGRVGLYQSAAGNINAAVVNAINMNRGPNASG